MNSSVSFVLDDAITSIDFEQSKHLRPTTTVLNYLRGLPNHKGVKEGCAEGDCGACTVVIGEPRQDGTMWYRSIDSCLVFLPMLHGKQVITVENLRDTAGNLHPVQHAMVETGGSQCGYCTPGIIMSLFSLYKNTSNPGRDEIDDALTGNLCRCTGYRPIVEAAARACVNGGSDHLTQREEKTVELLKSIPQDTLVVRTEDQLYMRPNNLKEALALKRRHPRTLVVCGATDVALRVTKKHEVLQEIIDLSGIHELTKIDEQGGRLSIGAGATLSDIMPRVLHAFPALHDMLAVFGSQQIRNLATLGGNLGTASPIGDTLPVLLAYKASIVLEDADGSREVPMSEFVTGYRKTVRRPDELITQIILPQQTQDIRIRSYKVSKRRDLDIATASAGFRLGLNNTGHVEEIILAYGGMADRVRRATKVEQFLLGKRWSRDLVEQAMTLIDDEFSPISDARAGATMRLVAAKNLLLKFWSETNGNSH